MLSIGKLAPGPAAADYYIERRAGCPLDYYTGRGEASGVWIGHGSAALNLHGALDSPEREQMLRRLLAGQGPDGTELVRPVLRGDPRGRVPAAVVVRALEGEADTRGVEVSVLLQSGDGRSGTELARVWQRTSAELQRARRRPHWPAPSLSAEAAQRLLDTAGLDATEVLAQRTPTGRVRDVLARALRHRDDRVDVRLPGLDLTLSAPKSVSLLWALSPETSHPQDGHPVGEQDLEAERVGEQVRQAHRVAVAESLAYLELTCTSALRGHHRGDGTDRHVDTEGLIGAAFEHRSSRCGDPQLHTHVVVANLLHGRDGRWSAVNTREIYAHARTAGFVYQAVLRGELTRRLGVAWTPVRNGQAEIAGVPVGLLRLFSKRRAQIEHQLTRLGLEGSAAAQVAALDTRPAKPHTPSVAHAASETDALADAAGDREQVGLRDRWRDEATVAGHHPDQLQQVLHQPDTTSLLAQARPAAVATGPVADELSEALLAPTGLTDKRATFDRRDLLRGVCEHLPAGLPVRLSGLRALATRVLRDARVVPLLGDAPVDARRYSTRELLAVEHDALALATSLTEGRTDDAMAAPMLGVVPADVLDRAEQHASERGCTEEQLVMLRRLLTSGAGVEVIVGAAGSGKTTALAVAAQAWQQHRIPVQGAALAAIAARVLQDSAGIGSRSLQRLLNQLDQPGFDPARLLPPGGVLVVDEAGMVGTRTLHRLITLAAEQHTKLVLVGDPKQLPEIEAGGLFATLAARLPAVLLLGNQRQQARWEQRALRELRDGDVLKALSAYRSQGRVRVEDGIGELTARLLADYEQHLTVHRPEQVLVIASSRGDARRLNAQLRQRLLEHGRLGSHELRIPLLDARDGGVRGERGYRLGEQVLVTMNDYPRGLLNGTRGTIATLHPEQQAVTVRFDDGRNVHLDRDYLMRGHLTHGYALTAHKAQGTTVDVALLWGTQALTRETGYVALSRGRQANYLYATWDLLQRDTGLTDRGDLDGPSTHHAMPDLASRRRLATAALVQRLETTGQQRTARSWWHRRATTPPKALPSPVRRMQSRGWPARRAANGWDR